MSYIALPIWIIVWYFLDKKIGQKTTYSIFSRILSGAYCTLTVIAIYGIQNYRIENYNFWFGVLPSFLAAFALPFCHVAIGRGLKLILINRTITWTISTCILLITYETILWLDGRTFDIYDVFATILGAIVGAFLVTKIAPPLDEN